MRQLVPEADVAKTTVASAECGRLLESADSGGTEDCSRESACSRYATCQLFYENKGKDTRMMTHDWTLKLYGVPSRGMRQKRCHNFFYLSKNHLIKRAKKSSALGLRNTVHSCTQSACFHSLRTRAKLKYFDSRLLEHVSSYCGCCKTVILRMV